MKRWLPLFSTILAVGFTVIEAHAQNVGVGLSAIYAGTIRPIPPDSTGLTQSTQQITVNSVDLANGTIRGTTVITNYLLLSGIERGVTSVEWICRSKLCILTNPRGVVGVIAQFWVNPSNPLGSILTPQYSDGSDPNDGKSYNVYMPPGSTFPPEARSDMTCPTGKNITCISYTVIDQDTCTTCLLLGFGKSGFVKHFRQWRSPPLSRMNTFVGTAGCPPSCPIGLIGAARLSPPGGEFIYTRTSIMKPIQSPGDYKAALARIGTLMDAEPDTSEGKELATLTDMVKFFETGAMAK
jgi:hypothetical protein